MIRIVRWSLTYPVFSFVLLLISTGYFAVNLTSLQLDTSQDGMFGPDDPEMEFYRGFVQDFGSDELLAVFFEHDVLFDLEILNMIDRLTHKFEKIEHVEQVLSLTNFNTIYNKDDILIVGSLEQELPYLTKEDMPSLEKRLITDPLINKFSMISKSGRGTGIGLLLDKDYEGDYRVAVVREVEEIIKEEDKSGIRFYIGGNPFMQVALNEAYNRDIQLLGPIMFGMVLLILIAIFRRPLFALLPLLVTFFGAIWTFGFISAMGWYVTPLTEVALPLLIVYSIVSSMHFFNNYRNRVVDEKSKSQAILGSVGKVWKPCFYASLTTCLGFSSLTISSVQMVKDLGLYCAFAVGSCFLMTFWILPLCLNWLSVARVPRPLMSDTVMPSLMRAIADFTANYRGAILTGLVLIVLPLSYWISKIEIDTDAMKLLKEDAEVVQSEAAGRQIFGLWAPLELSVEVVGEGQLDNPVYLEEIRKLQEYIDSKVSYFGRTLSVVDILSKANQELHGGDPQFYSIPDNPGEVRRLLNFVGSVVGEKGLTAYLRDDLKRARITARSGILSSREHASIFREIESYIDANISKALDIRFTGNIWQGQVLLVRILKTEIQSFSIAFGLILFCLLIAFRSWRFGLIAIPVNLFPVVVILGMMGIFDINLDVGTCTVASIVIAMAVDDTIHFLYRFREEMKKHENYGVAIQKTMAKVGPPIVYTSLVLAAGFWVLIFSSYVPALNFGFLSGVAVLAALVGDIVILPAMLLWVKPIKVWKPMWRGFAPSPATADPTSEAEPASPKDRTDSEGESGAPKSP